MTVFDDGKEDGALRTIGEVGQALGLKPHVLRYWEEQFPTLKPLKRSGGRRYYRPGDVALVETIDRLVNREGYTLKGAMLVYPWEEERKQVILAHARTNNTRAVCLRAIDPLLVLNVLARARTNLLQPRAPLALEASYLERALITDDSRLLKLAQLTGYIEEVIPEEAKLDEDAEE